MKLNITIDFDTTEGLDNESIQQAINEVTVEEVRKVVRRLVQDELSRQQKDLQERVKARINAATGGIMKEIK